MSFNPPDYYSPDDYPLVRKKDRPKRKKMPRLYGLRVGDRIELVFIDIPDDDTDLQPGDKGIVNEILKTSNDYEINVFWDKGYCGSDYVLLASSDKWKIIKYAK